VLNQFLRRLNSDREYTGMEYETLHCALIVFFEQHGRFSPETMADETLNRVAIALGEGTKIDNLSAYTLAVARNLLKENWHSPLREVTTIEKLPVARTMSSNPGALKGQLDLSQYNEERLECMKKCLNELPDEDYSLIQKYYVTECVPTEEQRKKLAHQMGISLKVLRDRIHYIRVSLEGCLNDCLG